MMVGWMFQPSTTLLLPLLLLPQLAWAQSYGDFRYVERIDAMTDENRSYVYTEDRSNSGLLRSGGAVWRCKGESVEFAIIADDFLETDDPVRVQWRIDNQPPSEPARWNVSTEGTAVFASDITTFRLTEMAKPASRLRVRLTDYRGTDHDLDFSLRGLTAGLDRLPCSMEALRAAGEEWLRHVPHPHAIVEAHLAPTASQARSSSRVLH